VARFQAAITSSVTSSRGVMAVISTHTWPRSMPCRRYQKMATTSSSDSTAWITRRRRERGVAGAGFFWSTIISALS
jgi:hypothetical protein